MATSDRARRDSGTSNTSAGRRGRSSVSSGSSRAARDERRTRGQRKWESDAGSAGRSRGASRTDRSGDESRAAGTRSRSGASPRRSAPADSAKAGSSTTQFPPVPEHADISLLDRGVRAELRSLSKPNAEAVGRHLVAAGEALDSDPTTALAHARAARARAARIAAVREAVGVAAYHAGEWAEALTELRTARRISGDPRTLPLIADCERALGRPDRALRTLSDPDLGRLDAETRSELFIVVAGARRDLGQVDAALAVLARGGLDRDRPRPGSARLWYAYADGLEAAGRRDEAATWFAASAALDPEGELDAADRAAALL